MTALDWDVNVSPTVPADIRRRLQRACSAIIADATCNSELFERFGHCTWVVEEYFTMTLINFEPQHGIKFGFAIDIDAPDASSEYVLAETLQENLAYDEQIQWPVLGKEMLTPKFIDGKSVWVKSAGAIVSEIGKLSL